jgi:hypothetical protein
MMKALVLLVLCLGLSLAHGGAPTNTPPARAATQAPATPQKPIPAAAASDARLQPMAWYNSLTSAQSKDEVLRGIGALQLNVVLVTPIAKAAMSQERLEAGVSQVLKNAGIKLSTNETAPVIVLSVDTLEFEKGLTFNIGLAVIEQSAVQRNGAFLKAPVKSWDTTQLGSFSYTKAGDAMTKAVGNCLDRFVATYSRVN